MQYPSFRRFSHFLIRQAALGGGRKLGVNIQETEQVSLGKGEKGNITKARRGVLLAEYSPSMHEAQAQSPALNKMRHGGARLQS